MASLRSTTTKSELHKYLEATVEIIESSMSKGTKVSATNKPGSFTIKDTDSNRAILGEFIKLISKKNNTSSKQAINLRLEVVGVQPTGGGLPFGSLDKPSKPSKGDIGEAVIAAAICARFVFKHGSITPQRVIDMMKTLGSKGIGDYPGKKGKYVEAVFKSQNKGIKMYDDVRCYISLNKSAITASLFPKSEYGKWAYKDVIPAYARSACSYVNSGKVSKWAETVYTNMRYDNIDIRSDGLGDQKGTKVDTRVKITDQEGISRPVNINLSMKVDDVKQFGQVSGMTFSVQQELWKQLFGYTTLVNQLEKEWNKLTQEQNNLPGALNMVYDKVFEQVQQDIGVSSTKENLVRKISEGITYFATRHEEHVEILNLGKGGAKLYSFNDFYNLLLGVENLGVSMKTQKNNLRQMSIVGKSSKTNKELVLISIRIRREPDAKKGSISYIRNLIEKSKLLGELLAESLD